MKKTTRLSGQVKQIFIFHKAKMKCCLVHIRQENHNIQEEGKVIFHTTASAPLENKWRGQESKFKEE